MILEGYYQTKPACYTSDLINPDDPKCLSGSPWVASIADHLMGDDTHFKNPNAKMTSIDEFHRASSLFPFHHPEIQGSCNGTQLAL